MIWLWIAGGIGVVAAFAFMYADYRKQRKIDGRGESYRKPKVVVDEYRKRRGER